MVYDLRAVLSIADGRGTTSYAAILDSRTMQSASEPGRGPGTTWRSRGKGARCTSTSRRGPVLALRVTQAWELDRARVAKLGEQTQEVTGDTVEKSWVGRVIPATALAKR